MSYTLIYTPMRFAVPPAGFDSDYRYFRRVSGGTIAISAGRTWRTSMTATTNNGQPWVGFRFAMGVGSSIDMVTSVVSGSSQSQTVAAVSPTSALCEIE